MGRVQGPQAFSVKGQIVNILGFAGQPVSAITIQLCCCNTFTKPCAVPINLFTKSEGGTDLVHWPQLADS